MSTIEQGAFLDLDYQLLIAGVKRLFGVDLTGYKPEQMRRRLLSLAGRYGQRDLQSFVAVMEKDEKARKDFERYYTINVTEFLRDPQRWIELSTRILPFLYRQNGSQPLRVWSAGCSNGAEPYTAAMLLEEMTPGVEHRVVATDIDPYVLARAQAGTGYLEQDLRNIEAPRRNKFLTRGADKTYSVKDSIKSRVQFMKHDLLADAPPQELDLIISRNVVIYFTDDAKRGMYTRMSQALKPGGILFVGGTEMIPYAQRVGLEPFRTSFYRKPSGNRVPATVK